MMIFSNYDSPALVSYGLASDVTVALPVAGPHTLYRLQAAGQDESSHSVQLNGEVLKLSAEITPLPTSMFLETPRI